jgi:hypothetical protein
LTRRAAGECLRSPYVGLATMHLLIEAIRNAKTEFELIMAQSEPAKKMLAVKMH